MILVAGLAVAGLAGIAAAFYFSMRPRGSRVRAAGPGRAADSRVPASRSRTSPPSSGRSDRPPAPSARPEPIDPPDPTGLPGPVRPRARWVCWIWGRTGRGATGASTVIDFTGPQPVLDDAEPAVTGRRARHGDRLDDTRTRRLRRLCQYQAAGPRRGTSRRPARTRPTTQPRRPGHVGAWAGVRDPTSTRNCGRPSRSAVSPTSSSGTTWPPTSRWPRPRAPLSRRPPPGGGRRIRARCRTCIRSRAGAARTAGAPRPRARARTRSPASARTTGPRSSRPFRPPVRPGATAPLATQPYPTATQPSPIAAQPVRCDPSRCGAQPARQPPAGSRGRSRAAISADEDPLTSPAYSLRAKGSVDGRSRRPDLGREQYEAAVAQETQAFSVADTQAAGGGYPDRVPPFRQFDRPAHSANGRGRSDGYRSDPLRSDPLRRPIRCGPIPCGRSCARSAAARSPAGPIRRRTDPLRSDHFRPDPPRPGDGYGATGAYPYPHRSRSRTASRLRRRALRPTASGTDTALRPASPIQLVILGERTAAGVPARPAQTAPVTEPGPRVRGIRRSTATAGPTIPGATTAG